MCAEGTALRIKADSAPTALISWTPALGSGYAVAGPG
jgi:hypothetical protein